jgi:hypothetical protein
MELEAALSTSLPAVALFSSARSVLALAAEAAGNEETEGKPWGGTRPPWGGNPRGVGILSQEFASSPLPNAATIEKPSQ